MKNINEISLGKALAQKLKQELLNPRQDLINLNPRIRALLDIYKKLFPYGIPPGLAEKFQEIEINPPVGPGASIAIEDMKNMWRGMLNDRRILCLSESATIPPMWNHYADGYKGVVIEFECIDELDSAWLIAKPINYTNEMPLTYTAEDMADLLFYQTVNQLTISTMKSHLSKQKIGHTKKNGEYQPIRKQLILDTTVTMVFTR